jgi:hypothetical protein
VVSGDSIRFIVLRGGGNFAGSDTSEVVTNGSGIAEGNLTTGIVADSNIVTALRVDDPADSVQFAVVTVSGGVSYYTFIAYDQYNNRVATSDSVTLTAVGSVTAGFSPGPYLFGGVDSLNFRVSDTTSGSFTVRADNIDNPAITGSSGLITIPIRSMSVESVYFSMLWKILMATV